MIHVRVTDDLKARLEAAARDAGRSVNAEIVQRLTWTLDDHRFYLHGPDGPEPSLPDHLEIEISEVESKLDEDRLMLSEMIDGPLREGWTERERAGAIGWQKAHIKFLEEKLQTLRRAAIETRLQERFAQIEKDWDAKYPDGKDPPSPWDEAIAEYDRIHGAPKDS